MVLVSFERIAVRAILSLSNIGLNSEVEHFYFRMNIFLQRIAGHSRKPYLV